MRPKKIVAESGIDPISIHAPLTGCDYGKGASWVWIYGFQSTHPLRDATHCVISSICACIISIHAPLTGCDTCYFVWLWLHSEFQSTHPLRDATVNQKWRCSGNENFNPRTPYGMRQIHARSCVPEYSISIHAPLTGCDKRKENKKDERIYFNPRTPYGMRLVWHKQVQRLYTNFNPRTPYGMRHGVGIDKQNFGDFNPRTPYGMRQKA